MEIIDQVKDMQHNPWLYDDTLNDGERMYWKLKNICHVCGISVRFHRDDCPFSAVQLMWRSNLYTIDTTRFTIRKNEK